MCKRTLTEFKLGLPDHYFTLDPTEPNFPQYCFPLPLVNGEPPMKENNNDVPGASLQKSRNSVIKPRKVSSTAIGSSMEKASEHSAHTAVDMNGSSNVKEVEIPPRPPPPISIFLQSANFLLDVNVLQVKITSILVTWRSL